MGHGNSNAGIHMIPHNYKASFDSVDAYDKYATMLAESKKEDSENIVHRYRTNIDIILKENNVVLWGKKVNLKTVNVVGDWNIRKKWN